MTDKTLYVVGNKFRELSNGETLLSFDEALERTRSDNLNGWEISLQQGVSESQSQYLTSNLANSKNLRLYSYFDRYQRCDSVLTHKSNAANTLISEPTPMTEKDAYSCIVMIDDTCTDLSDHVTGKHIPFMVLTEAARQMATAVTEKFYSTAAKIYLSEDLHVRFNTFVYPFEIRLECRVTSLDLRATGDGKMAVSIDFLQRDKVACQVSMAYTVIDRRFIASLESNALKTFVHRNV